jgi:iron complex outermembrane receptor protein
MEDEWLHLTPTVGIDREIGDRALVYAKSTYAFKPGGFSAYADDPAYVPFNEERVWASEAGIKTAWLDQRLTANLAGFYSSVEDYQVERSFTVTDYAVFNAAEAEIYGVEFDSRYSISPNLDFQGSIGYTHATLTDYTDPITGANLDGVTAPFVPEFDAVAALDYHLENGLFARIEYLATGNTKFDDFNRAEFQQNAYGLINAAVGWRNDQRSISVFGTNLGAEEYYTIMNTDIRTGAVGIPRIIGVKAGIQF